MDGLGHLYIKRLNLDFEINYDDKNTSIQLLSYCSAIVFETYLFQETTELRLNCP